MKRLTFLILMLMLVAPVADAACYADYKAKRLGKGPLRLHYGVAELADRDCGNRREARAALEGRLARQGWELLNIVGLFDREGLDQRRESAGEFFLRF